MRVPPNIDMLIDYTI